MKTIAIPIFGSRVSSRIDCAESFLLVSVERGEIRKRETVRLVATNHLEKINMLIKLDPDVLICGGLTEVCANKLQSSHLQVLPWIHGEAEEVLSLYLEGKLQAEGIYGRKA